MKHKWNEEEFNHIAYAYRSCPLQDVEMVSQRYKELVDYVLNVFNYYKQQTKELKCLNVYSVDGEIKLFENKNGALIPCKNPLNVFCIGKIKLESEE